MANLYLTHKCNRGCPFCFARKVLKESGDVEEILTLDDIERLLDRYGDSMKVVGLLGGEPFLYPYFDQLMELLERRGVFAKVFTSGTNPMPECLKHGDIEKYAGRCAFVVNVGTRDTYSDEKFANLEQLLNRFGPLCTLSFTVFDLEEDPSYLFDMIDKYGLNRDIRTGIALPIYNGGNTYIDRKDYKQAGDYVTKVAKMAAKRSISLSFDCGFTTCMFTTEQLGSLLSRGADVSFKCGAAIDIGPGLKAWNCFPLFQLTRLDAMDYDSLDELGSALMKQSSEALAHTKGIFDECETCDMFAKKMCLGGCKSFKSVE